MGTPNVKDQLRRALSDALKSRDMVAVSALRSALGAIDNATAVPAGAAVPAVPAADAGPAPAASASSPHFAGAAAGLGAAEAERRRLSDDDVSAIVRAEVAERQAAAREYERAGHVDRAERLRREADILAAALTVER
jgi:uncharacterized protein